ncbi:hypothetical protein [uncultured Chryseobacterium sp.]|uniref:hypothetical protein n=1 Tax=uncultured Chryseobacterium sp. TaxID=259322 RepID=UPI0025CEF869|nr:hypothetical protein [uncultured Chryseobacterium sp.]
MPDLIFPLFFIALFAFAIGKTIYYFVEKNKIVETCKLADTVELKNISGTIFTNEGTFKKKYEWCSFDIMINTNSIFLFSKGFSVIPFRVINLLFSNSDRKNTRKPTLLREYKISSNQIKLVYYPEYLNARSRTITLHNLNTEQVSLFENLLEGKSRRFY